MIIDRYIAAEVLKPFLLVTAVLGLIYVAISFAALLDRVLVGKLELSVITTLILLRTLIALEVLLPSALFVAVIIALRRLHSDVEIISLWSCGVSDIRIVRPLLVVITSVAVLVALISLVGRPWAYQNSYAIEEQASLQAGLQNIQAERFVSMDEGARTVFIESRDPETGVGEEVFVQEKVAEGLRVIRARTMEIHKQDGRLLAQFTDGHLYVLKTQGAGDTLLDFSNLDIWLDTRPTETVRNKRKAYTTERLSTSSSAMDIAEYQWRLSGPVTTLLLGILAIPLGKVRPGRRSSNSARIIFAVVLFGLFFSLAGIFRTWLEHEDITPVPGLWWVHLAFIGMLLGYFLWQQRRYVRTVF